MVDLCLLGCGGGMPMPFRNLSATLLNFKGRKISTETIDGDSDCESDFSICKKTKCIAVLTENFFFDNVDDVNYILSEEGKDAVIRTHVDGIIEYLK
jgi:N-acetylmuramoyl-L-alanine amidase